METQNVHPDAKGNYTVQLGANKSDGLPLELFSSGEARWLTFFPSVCQEPSHQGKRPMLQEVESLSERIR